MSKLLLIAIVFLSIQVQAQKYFTRTGLVYFFSEAPLENIEATNNQASCIVDAETGELVSKILLKAFEFEKALMQEHFNENYVESDKYPQAVLKAKVENIEELNLSTQLEQKVILTGELSIKDVTRQVKIEGKVKNTNGVLNASAFFIIRPEEYNIAIPRAVRNNIAQEIEVSVTFNLEAFKR